MGEELLIKEIVGDSIECSTKLVGVLYVQALSCLDEIEFTCIDYYYGLNSKERKNEEEIAKIIGTTKQDIKDIICSAFLKLRNPVIVRKLKAFN